MLEEPSFDPTIFDDVKSVKPQPLDALYFTDALISDRNVLAALVLLFDRVFVYYNRPNYYIDHFLKIASENSDGMRSLIEDVAGRHSYSENCHETYAGEDLKRSLILFLRDINQLRSAGVVHPLFDESIPPDWDDPVQSLASLTINSISITSWARRHHLLPKGKLYLDEPAFLFHRLFSASSGLCLALNMNLVPISDNLQLFEHAQSGIICNSNSHTEELKQALITQSALMIALASMKETIPNIGALDDDQLLNLRKRLEPQRAEFLGHLKELAADLSQLSRPSKTADEVQSIVKGKILPSVESLSLAIEQERGKLIRKVSTQFFVGAPALSVVANLPFIDPAAPLIGIGAFLGKVLLDVHEYQETTKAQLIRRESKGLAFLLAGKKALQGKNGSYEWTDPVSCGLHPQLLAWNNRSTS